MVSCKWHEGDKTGRVMHYFTRNESEESEKWTHLPSHCSLYRLLITSIRAGNHVILCRWHREFLTAEERATVSTYQCQTGCQGSIADRYFIYANIMNSADLKEAIRRLFLSLVNETLPIRNTAKVAYLSDLIDTSTMFMCEYSLQTRLPSCKDHAAGTTNRSQQVFYRCFTFKSKS